MLQRLFPYVRFIGKCLAMMRTVMAVIVLVITLVSPGLWAKLAAKVIRALPRAALHWLGALIKSVESELVGMVQDTFSALTGDEGAVNGSNESGAHSHWELFSVLKMPFPLGVENHLWLSYSGRHQIRPSLPCPPR